MRNAAIHHIRVMVTLYRQGVKQFEKKKWLMENLNPTKIYPLLSVENYIWKMII